MSVKQLLVPALAVLLLLSACARPQDSTPAVYFSPNGGVQGMLVHEIQGARTSILVQAYSFTNQALGRALVEAHHRGVAVAVIMDRERQEHHRYAMAEYLARNGVPTYIDAGPGLAHSKVMLFDNATVVTGSYNFTKGAEVENVENLLVIRDPALADRYAAHIRQRLATATPYIAAGAPGRN